MKLLPLWWRAHFLSTELGLAVALGVSFGVWDAYFDKSCTVNRLLDGNRGAIYGALASIFGSLLGFAITAVSIVIGFASHEGLAVVRQSRHYQMLWQVFFSSIRALGLATVLALVGMVVDRDRAPQPLLLYLITFASLLAVLRVARCAWILEHVVELLSGSKQNSQ